MKSINFYNTTLGTIGIASENEEITEVIFAGKSEDKAEYKIEENRIIKEAHRQLIEYLSGKRKHFELKLEFRGTEFQKKVWETLLEIPYGETWSYQQVATKTGNKKACRAVGMANNRNPIPIFVPCHRVIGADGKLVGYAGGLHMKKKLLELERNNI